MDTARVLEVEFNNQALRFPVEPQDSHTSPFTGNVLEKLQTRLTVSRADAETIRQLVGAGEVSSRDGRSWTAVIDTESYTNDGSHTLSMTWSEAEQVSASVVDFAGLQLLPTTYEERENEDGSICVSFQATLTAEDTDVLRSLAAVKQDEDCYFPVIRRGVSDEPRSMRLGRVLWQRLEGGQTAQEITLVDEAFDHSERNNALLALGGEPMISNLIAQLSRFQAQFESLLNELEAGGTLSG
jgi:hypothetical protein